MRNHSHLNGLVSSYSKPILPPSVHLCDSVYASNDAKSDPKTAVFPLWFGCFICNAESECLNDCTHCEKAKSTPCLLLLRLISNLVKRVCTIGFLSKIANTACSFPCRLSSVALLCFSRIKANQLKPASLHLLVF